MNKIIRELDSLTINQIAAGEVVERPLSVVKELVENAIDAESTAITVEIKEGGIKLIRVTDNGSGISHDQVKSAFQRHFTSKIEKIDDLFSISSLGFRGEALASIAGVAMTEMITKTEEALVGTRLAQTGVTETIFEEVGAPKGTTVIVKELFFNTPARRKFLKSEKTETSYVLEFMQRISLAYRWIAFKLIVDGKVRLQTNGDGDLRAAILYIFGSETAKRLKEVHYSEKDVKVTGFIGTPELNRGNRNYEIYFVNGRYVKSKWIQEGLEEGVFGYVMQHQFPFAVLEITARPDKVDVNVHPQKAEVRFENGYLIKEIVSRAIKQAIEEKEAIPAVSLEQSRVSGFQPDKDRKERYDRTEPFEALRQAAIQDINKSAEKRREQTTVQVQRPVEEVVFNKKSPSYVTQPVTAMLNTGQVKEDRALFLSEKVDQDKLPIENTGLETAQTIAPKSETAMAEMIREKSEEFQEQEFIEVKSLKKHRVIGQLFDTYWLVEFEGALYVIDQHAAHEKVLYERFVKQFNDSQIHAQQLLEPLIIELNAREMQSFFQTQTFFQKLGFEVEQFGSTTLKVNGVPYLFNQAMKREDFVYLLDQLENKTFKDKAEIIDHELATMACKAAVKGNNKLSRIEYERLIEELLALQNPYHCPHGRPTLIKMTRYELDRKFKRIL
ncbi:DNA mismatch repair endonuclease MutL [Clostridiales bacterium COT073_COT-073]|nr:DNA mismatch repair endonuclease MutL [Clostridiales bacterium COT073_COT-073]